MAELDSFSFVADGDQLDDGYFNGITNFYSKQLITNTLNNLINSEELSYENFKYDTFTDFTKIDTSNSDGCWYVGGFAFCTAFDNFDGASIDTTKWTNSVWVIANDVITHSATANGSTSTATIISDGTSGLDFKSFSGNSECFLHFRKIYLSTDGGTAQAQLKIQLSDGTTHVDLVSYSAPTGSSTSYTDKSFNLVINKSGSTVDVYVDGTLDQNDVDISSLGSNWYLRIYSYATESGSVNNAVVDNQVECVGYIDGSSGNITFVSTGTSTSNVDVVPYAVFTENNGGSLSVSVSGDGGSNYTSATNGELVKISVSGSSLVFKVVGAKQTTVDATKINISTMRCYGVLY